MFAAVPEWLMCGTIADAVNAIVPGCTDVLPSWSTYSVPVPAPLSRLCAVAPDVAVAVTHDRKPLPSVYRVNVVEFTNV